MDYKAIVAELLNEMRGDEVPDRFVRKIEFTIGRDRFEVLPEDFDEWRECRPTYAENVHYHIDVQKIVASIKAEKAILMACFR